MLDKSRAREFMLQRKREKKLTWEEIGKAIGRSPVYAAMLLYSYGKQLRRRLRNL